MFCNSAALSGVPVTVERALPKALMDNAACPEVAGDFAVVDIDGPRVEEVSRMVVSSRGPVTCRAVKCDDARGSVESPHSVPRGLDPPFPKTAPFRRRPGLRESVFQGAQR